MRECDGAGIGWHEGRRAFSAGRDSRVELNDDSLRNDTVKTHHLPHVAFGTPIKNSQVFTEKLKTAAQLF